MEAYTEYIHHSYENYKNQSTESADGGGCLNFYWPLELIGIYVEFLKKKKKKKGKRKVQGVPQLQTAALPRHQEEEETDKTKQAQIEQTYEKHKD